MLGIHPRPRALGICALPLRRSVMAVKATERGTEIAEDRGFILSLCDKKYVILYNWQEPGQFEAKRYNENWRDLTGDNLVMALCQEVMAKPTGKTIDDQLEEMFEYHMSEVQEEYPELTHGAMTMTAAERVVEKLQELVFKIADNRKWGHIDEVNKAHFDKPHAGGADPFTGG
jgi:hypothetical protein